MIEIGTPVLVRDDGAGVIIGRFAGYIAPAVCDLRYSRKLWEWAGKPIAVEDVAVSKPSADNIWTRAVEFQRLHHCAQTIVISEDQYSLFMAQTARMDQ